MKTITQLLEAAQARISGRKDYGPLGLAIAHLNVVVAEGKKRSLKSDTFDAVEVVLDHVHKQRDALEIAGLIVMAITTEQSELVKGKVPLTNHLPMLLQTFKEKAVEARIHQVVPPSDAARDDAKPS